MLEGLERQAPRKLRQDYLIYVYWTRFNDTFVPDHAKLQRFLERVVTLCSTIGINVHWVSAWDHIVNPHKIADRSVYERDINILVYFGRIDYDVDGGFVEDVFCPGLRHLANALNPYVFHVGHDDFSLNLLNFNCIPTRKIETKIATLPEPDTVLGDSAIEALASFIARRVLRVREVVEFSSHENIT